MVNILPASAGDVGLIPGLGRFPGVGNGNLFQYTCLENRMDEEPGRLQSVGLHRVRHDWPHARVIRIYLLFCIPVNSTTEAT